MLAISQIAEHDDNNRAVSQQNQTDSIKNSTTSKGNSSVLDFNWVVGDGGDGDDSFIGINNSERYN